MVNKEYFLKLSFCLDKLMNDYNSVYVTSCVLGYMYSKLILKASATNQSHITQQSSTGTTD